MKLLARWEKCCEVWMLIGILFGFFLLRLPSLYEPYWYGDEGIYEVIGKALGQGRLLYSGIWDNKPPLLYVLYAMFQADQSVVRFVSLIFGLGAIVAFFYLARMLFMSHRLWFFTTVFFSFFLATPLIEGNIANAENFMILPITLAALLLYRTTTSHHKQFSIPIAGFLLGIAFLFKIVALFDFAAMGTFLLFTFFTERSTNIKRIQQIKTLLLFIVAFIAPFLFTYLVFLLQNNFSYFLEALLVSNVGYVGWKNEFIIPQGFLFFKIFLLLLSCSLLFFYRKKITPVTTFIILWLCFSLFNAFFSQRPYIHYQLVLLPSVSLLLGLLFSSKHLLQRIIFLGITLITFLLIAYNFHRWSLEKTVAYYDNFIQFMLHKKTLVAYQSFFDWNVPRDYQLAYYVKKHTAPQDNIFIWGNSAQIYVLANKLPPGRYTVAYHIGNNKQAVTETQQALDMKKPKFILMMPDIAYYPFSLHNYVYKLTIGNTHIYEKIR